MVMPINAELQKSSQLMKDLATNIERAVQEAQKLGGALSQGIRPLAQSQGPSLAKLAADARSLINVYAEASQALAKGGTSGVIPGGERGLANFSEAINKAGASLGVIQSRSVTANSDLVRFNIAFTNTAGIANRFSVYMNSAGTVLQDTQKRFRSFGDSIIRDIAKVAEWSIATGVVFGAMNKLSEVVSQATKVQADLADISIITGVRQEHLGGVLSSVNKIAEETSSTLDGVLEGYKLAYAATGEFADAGKRAVATQSLLKDSMVLSKLANINQAQALDTLVGALRQTDRELTEGSDLLDEWVMTSRSANVSINTLASSFAIVGSAAGDVGLKSKELNAVIATLAESTKLSADETGNAIRGFISGFQSDKAQQVVARYGIALKNVNGELRDFTDIVEQLASMSRSGILSEKDLAVITNAVGGGYRRGAQFAALVKNYDRALQLMAAQENSAGQATRALNIELTTLESASTRLQNAFTMLSASLGSEGGILSFLTLLTNAATMATKAMSGLSGVFGSALPILGLGTLGARGLSGSAFGQKLLNETLAPSWLMRLAGTTQARGFATPLARVNAGIYGPMANYQGSMMARELEMMKYGTIGGGLDLLNQKITRNILGALGPLGRMGYTTAGGQTVAGGALSKFQASGLIAPAIIAGAQGAEGDWAGAGVAVGGAVVGALITGGTPIGMAIGSAAGTAMYEAFFGDTRKISTVLADIISQVQSEQAPDQGAGAAQVQADLEKQLEYTGIQSLVFGITGAFTQAAGAIYEALTGKETPSLGARDLFVGSLTGDVRGGAGFITPEQQKAFNQMQAGGSLIGGAGPGISMSRYMQMQAGYTESVSGLAAQAEQEMIQRLRNQLRFGEISGTAYKSGVEGIGSLGTQAGTLMTAYDIMNKPLDPKSLLAVLINLRPEETETLTTFADNIVQRTADLETLRSQPQTKEVIDQIAEMEKQRNLAVTGIQGFVAETFPVAAMRSKQILPIVDTELTAQQIAEAYAEGVKLAKKDYAAMGYTPEEIQILADQWEESMVRGSDQALNKIKLPQNYFKYGMENLGYGDQTKSIGLVNWQDYTTADVQQMMPLITQMQSAIQTASGGKWQPSIEEYAIITKDGFTQQHFDMAIANLLLSEIKKNGEEQLEGVFNLPEGVAAAIPMTGQVYFGKSPYPTGESGGFASALAQLQAMLEQILGVAPVGTAPAISTAPEVINAALGNMITPREPVAPMPAAEETGFGSSGDWYDQWLASTGQPSRFERSQVGPSRLEEISRRKEEDFIMDQPIGGGQPPVGYNARSATGGGMPPMDIGSVIQNLVGSIQNMFPESIPITNKVNLETTNVIYLDGSKIAEQMNKKMFSDMKAAKRASGTVGYTVTQ